MNIFNKEMMSEEIDAVNFLKIYFTFMCMNVLPVCIYVY